MSLPEKDVSVLRRLAERKAAIAALPVQRELAEGWRRVNDLERGKPMVWINEIPWHEMDVDGELELKSCDPFCRALEGDLRLTLYQWDHMRGDMVIEGVMHAPLAIRQTGFGVAPQTDSVQRDERSSILSRHYHPQFRTEADTERIQTPEVAHDAAASARTEEQMVAIFGDILPVERRGLPGLWFAPWDLLVTWWGVQEALTDLTLRPELVHAAMDRLVSAHLSYLDQLERLGLLSRNDANVRIGSGGYGYTDALPQADFDAGHVRPVDLWGCATAQIFSEVSPAMHEEFALQYERRWLERFGLTYYGCCEPLDGKLGILRSVPNLRKISMSPWIKLDRAVEALGADYVFSYKPNPAVFAENWWNPELARNELREVLEKTRGCIVEVIMKDISTVGYEPQRLWEWAQIAAEETERVA